MPLTDRQAESETIIHIRYAGDGTKIASVYSSERAVWRRAERAGWKETMRDGGGREYEAPADQFRWSCRTAESARTERSKRAATLKARLARKTPVTVEDSERA